MADTKPNFIKFVNNSRDPVDRLAAKLGKLRGGESGLALPLPAAVVEAVLDYEKKIDKQLKDKGIKLS